MEPAAVIKNSCFLFGLNGTKVISRFWYNIMRDLLGDIYEVRIL